MQIKQKRIEKANWIHREKRPRRMARKSPIFMDDEVIGFGVQVRDTGRKSFTLDYTFEGRLRSPVIFPTGPQGERPEPNGPNASLIGLPQCMSP